MVDEDKKWSFWQNLQMGSRCTEEDFIQSFSFIKIKSANRSYVKKPSEYKLMLIPGTVETKIIPAFKKFTVLGLPWWRSG